MKDPDGKIFKVIRGGNPAFEMETTLH